MASHSTSRQVVLGTPSEFDYFRPQVLQTAIQNEYDNAVQCTSLTDHGNVLEFEIPGESNVFRDLSNSYLEVKCKVTKSNGSNIAAADLVAPANNFLHTLFSDCEISVCGTRITEKESFYAYRAIIESLLSTDADVLKMRSKLAGWHLDTEAADMDKVILAKTDNVEPSAAFQARHATLGTSKILTFVGRLHADLFHQDLDVPPNCKINVKLTRSSNKFVLMAAADAAYKVAIVGAKLHVRSKQVDPDLIVAQRQLLSRSNFRLPLNYVSIKSFTIGTGLQQVTFPNVFTEKLPKRIIIGMLKQNRIQGAYDANPFKFEHFSLSELKVSVSGENIPREPLTMDFQADDYQRAYLSTLAALGLDIGNRAIALTPELWANAYNLHAFKLVPGSIDDYVESARPTAPVNISFVFKTALAAPVEVLVYSETNRLLEIDAHQNVIVA